MNIDDPQLTAYALNELDAAERARIEALLEADPEARRHVDEIRHTAAMLSAKLTAAPTPSLTAQQHDEITAATASSPSHSTVGEGRGEGLKVRALTYESIIHRPSFWRRSAKWALAAAACAALVAGGYAMYLRQASASELIAQLNAQSEQMRAMRDKLVEERHKLNVDLTDALSKLEAERVRNAVAAKPATRPIATPTAMSTNEVLSLDPNLSGTQSNHLYADNMYGSKPFSRIDVLQNSTAFTQFPTTGVPGSIGNDQLLGTGTTGEAVASKVGGKSVSGPFDISSSGLPIASANFETAPYLQGGSTLAIRGTKVSISETPSQPTTIIQREQEQKQFPLLTSKGEVEPVNAPVAIAGSVPDGFTAGLKLTDGAKGDELEKRLQTQFNEAQAALNRGDHAAARAALSDARLKVLASATPDAKRLDEISLTLRQIDDHISSNESYASIHDNPFKPVAAEPLSTFSIDVDTASYSNIRRFIAQNQLPPADAVRIEEMLNYFPYDYKKPAPNSPDPFAADVEVAGCPWNPASRLVRVAVKGREIAHDKRPVSNLVFLIDVSGSMNEPKKLPLVKEGLKLMVNELAENDRVGIVVYAGAAGLVLPSTPADPKNKQQILAAIDNLSAGGSTNGGQGVELAYRLAAENFIKGGTNRVILATDGDWNVGITDQTSLIQLIEEKAKSGVFLSLLGFGFGNLKDSTLEKLADKGNGHYAYIDDVKEAKKVLVEEMSGTLVTIAKDVKVQIEFNPTRVESYRLIGYENRMLRKEDFNNDKIDAGEIGAGHAVTALYEVTLAKPATTQPATRPVDDLKYQKTTVSASPELLTLKLRYKQPDGDTSKLIEIPATDAGLTYAKASEDFKFSAAIAQFGMILRNSPHKGTASLDDVIELADEGKGKDEKGYRGEFVELVKKTKALVKK